MTPQHLIISLLLWGIRPSHISPSPGSVKDNLVGEWLSISKVPHFQRPGVIYADPAKNKPETWGPSGYETVKYQLTLRQDHTFTLILVTIAVSGKWRLQGAMLRLSFDPRRTDYANARVGVRITNTYATTSTNGVPDVDMFYHRRSRTLTWVVGFKKYKVKHTNVFRYGGRAH